MGFWGVIGAVYAPEQVSFDVKVDDFTGATAPGWHTFVLHRPQTAKRKGIARIVGVPKAAVRVVADVYDSDAALVALHGTDLRVRIWLEPEAAIGFDLQEPVEFLDDGSVVSYGDDPAYLAECASRLARLQAEGPGGAVGAGAARDWATAVGLAPGSVDELVPIIDGRETFVEVTVWNLMKKLGIVDFGDD